MPPGTTRRPTGPDTSQAAPRMLSAVPRLVVDTWLQRETSLKAISYSRNHHLLQVLPSCSDGTYTSKIGPRQYTAPVCLGCNKPASLLGPRLGRQVILCFLFYYDSAVYNFAFFCFYNSTFPFQLLAGLFAGAQSVNGQYVAPSAKRNQSTEQSARSRLDSHYYAHHHHYHRHH